MATKPPPIPSTSTIVPYKESEKADLSDYPFYPLPSFNRFEQQKASGLPRKKAIAMQQANKQAQNAAVAALNAMTSGAAILKAYPFIDAFTANKIANNKPTTWRYLDMVLMQRQVSKLLEFHKKQLGVNPPPATP